LTDIAETLAETLVEEQESDQLLTGIANNEITPSSNEA